MADDPPPSPRDNGEVNGECIHDVRLRARGWARWLLVFARSADTPAAPSSRQVAADAILAAAVAIASFAAVVMIVRISAAAPQGLRERVALYNGGFEAGSRPGGGWLVRARIPDPSAPASRAAPL